MRTMLAVMVAVLSTVMCGCAPSSPWEDNPPAEYILVQTQAATDPCLDDIMHGVPKEYRRCPDSDAPQSVDNGDRSGNVGGCPAGCEFPPPGCEVKGNISVDTGEKIYHLPGDEFYAETVISPQYGERWFCTADEAEANGWRRTLAR